MHPSSLARPAAALLGGAVLFVACNKVPYTGRTQPNLIPNDTMQALGQQTYQDMLSQERVVRKGADANTLQRVGDEIQRAADEPGFAWEFSLIDDDLVNAWCLPGGYIGFYTGILPTLRSEAGMAFVMGHEVGHAVAHHSEERLGQQLALLGGLSLVDAYLSGETKLSPSQRNTVLAALGVGAQLGVTLPFSRMHESEADVIGVMLMAEAGYPPAESIDVWDRMAAAGSGEIPEFLSTHPSPDTRQQNLREWLPQARKKFRRNKQGGNTLEPIWTGSGARSASTSIETRREKKTQAR